MGKIYKQQKESSIFGQFRIAIKLIA